MASLTLKAAAFAELTPKPLPGDPLVVIEPPRYGCLRVHVSLAGIHSDQVSFDIDVLPATTEVGHVKARS